MKNQLMTAGKPWRLIIQFTVPLLLGNLFQQFYSIADGFIISHLLGVNAFAGVSSVGSLSFLIIGFVSGMTAGLSIVIAQSYGAGEVLILRKQYIHNLIISFLTAVVMTIAALYGMDSLLNLLRIPQDIFQYAHDYLQVILIGIVASMLFNFYSNTLRALGDSRSPLIYLLIASGMNIVLDYILIAIPGMGVRGAALATILSQAFSALLCLIRILRKVDILSLRGYHEGFDVKMVLENLKYGLPMAFQNSITTLGDVIMQYAINGIGTVAIAAYGVSVRISGIAIEPLCSLGVAVGVYTAQNYGAGENKRILEGVRQCIGMAFLLSAALGILMFTSGRVFAAMFFDSPQPRILDMTYQFLVINGLFYFVLALLFVFRFTLQGFGHTLIPTVAGGVEVVARILTAILLVPVLRFTGVCWATPISWFASATLLVTAYGLMLPGLKASEAIIRKNF